MKTSFNNNANKNKFQYNEDKFLFRGKYVTIKSLSKSNEAEVVYSTIRRNIKELRKRVYEGKAEFNDKEIEKCLKKSKKKKDIEKPKRKDKIHIDDNCFDMFNKLF